VSVVGIDPVTERHLSQIDEAITTGEYFTGEDSREIVIGNKLAEILEVELGDRVVLTVARASSGDLAQEMFRISGIYFFNIDEMDRGMAFIRQEKAQEMLGLENEIHEIALVFDNAQYGRDKNNAIWDEYSTPGNEAVGWTVLLPQLEVVFAMSEFSTLLVAIMLFGVVALGIMNTLFMSLHERMFEFGVLRAVGTRPRAMAALVLLEAGALAIVSIILGMILGFGVTLLAAKTGIDYTGTEFAGVTFRELLYPVLQLDQFIVFPFWVFVFTVVIGLYPALFAARMSPAGAMRKSM
jgi:ABC-type lipoprotein release transport system permease subunit